MSRSSVTWCTCACSHTMTAGPECHVFTMSNEHNKERSEGQRGERTVDDTFLPCKEFSEFKVSELIRTPTSCEPGV